MDYPVVSEDPFVQGFYEHVRDGGDSHRMAEMLAFRQAPRANTDREFFEGRGTLETQFSGTPDALNYVIRNAMKHGYKPNPNDVYTSALARFPGDPQAFVPATGGRGHIQAVCERRGWACEGSVNVKSREPTEAPKSIRLGEDIVQKKIRKMVRENPDNARRPIGELRDEIINKHGSKKKG
jgi:hypothetical protein